MDKTAAWARRSNELPVGILGIIEQFILISYTMELDISISLGNLLHAKLGWSQLYLTGTAMC